MVGVNKIATDWVDLAHHRGHYFLKDFLNQIIFILVVAIERSPAHHRSLGDLSYSDGIKVTLFDQSNQRLAQEFLRTPHAQIAGVLRHFAPPVT